MDSGANFKKENKIKKFFSQFIKNVDKKMEEKAKSAKSCCGTDKTGNKSCCS